MGVKGQLKAATPAEYIAQVEDSRKADIAALDALIRKNAPKLAPFIHSGMLAYGPGGDWPPILLASNASYISMYVGSIAGRFREELPKANIGKSCMRFRRLSDLDTGALKKLIRECARAAAK